MSPPHHVTLSQPVVLRRGVLVLGDLVEVRDPELAVLVEVGVDYASDLAQVERVVVDVGRISSPCSSATCGALT